MQAAIAETVDGEWMILVDGVQWGTWRDKSGAGNATFKTRQEARLKLAYLYCDARREAIELSAVPTPRSE